MPNLSLRGLFRLKLAKPTSLRSSCLLDIAVHSTVGEMYLVSNTMQVYEPAKVKRA